MTALLNTADASCTWTYSNKGVSGATVESTLLAIDSTLATMARNYKYVLINLGVNNFVSLPEEATWRSNYQSIITAINGKWPTAKLYLTKPWKRDYDATAVTVAGWIDTLVAANPGVCFVADNEAVWLKGADNGATMTLDGIHYSAAGMTEKANQMITVLGY